MSPVHATPTPALDIGPWRPGDEASIGRLFARVFGRTRSDARWRWHFLEPDGMPRVVVARDADGEVVAHFGCVPRRFLADGAELLASNAVDSMVAPEHRAGLKRRGLFARLADGYVERFGWPGPDHFGYGLPNCEALRLGSRLLGYEPLGEVSLTVGPADTSTATAAGLELQVSTSPPTDHDALWRICSGAHVRGRQVLTVVRDRRYMTWRYERCPGGQFRFVLARRGGAPAALAVFAPSSPSDECSTVADLLWPGEDAEALRACLGGAAVLAQRAGRRHLALLVAATAPEARRLAAWGWRPHSLGLTLVARCCAPVPDLRTLRERWRCAVGDFDLV